MPISVGVGTVMRTVLFGRFNNAVETRNVFYHQVLSVGGELGGEDSLLGYARGLWDALKIYLRPVTASVQKYYQAECGQFDLATALVVNSEIYSIPSGEQAGTDGNPSLPPYATWTFKLVRPSSTYRHGFKRFAGVGENSQDNGIIQSGTVTAINAVASALAATLNPVNPSSGVAGGGLATPVITRQEQNGMPVRPVLVDNPVTVVFDLIGTQNSRKYGAGI